MFPIKNAQVVTKEIWAQSLNLFFFVGVKKYSPVKNINKIEKLTSTWINLLQPALSKVEENKYSYKLYNFKILEFNSAPKNISKSKINGKSKEGQIYGSSSNVIPKTNPEGVTKFC